MKENISKKNIWKEKFLNVPPGEHFASSLIRGLETRLDQQGEMGPERFADSVILLNTGRSVRTLENEFVKKGIHILPKIGLVTDLFFLLNGLFSVDEKIRIETRVEKILTLEKLIFKYLKKLGQVGQNENSFTLATDLEQVFRDLILAGLDTKAFNKIENLDLPSHWIESLGFLKIIKEYKSEVERKKILDQDSFNLFVLKLIEIEWQKRSPNSIIVVAGSTGSRHPTARLMRAVSKLPNGYIVLPGVDTTMSRNSWDGIKPDHPQYSFKKLFSFINSPNLSLSELGKLNNWTKDERTHEIKSRANALSFAMLPVSQIEMWRDSAKALNSSLKHAFKNVSILEATNVKEEAEAIALATCKALKENKSVSLVTSDKKLAKRVTMALKKWHIVPDDSFGNDPLQTPLSRFLRLILDFQCLKFDPINLFSLLKHPLCFLEQRSRHMKYLVDIEIRYFKGNLFEIGIDEIIKIISKETEIGSNDVDYLEWLYWLEALIKFKAKLPKISKENSLDTHLKEFESIIVLSSGLFGDLGIPKKASPELINKFLCLAEKTRESVFQAIFSEIRLGIKYSRRMNSFSFRGFINALIKELHIPFDPHFTTHDIYIWGTLESRTQSTDLCILGGLNEGTWPRYLRSDFWLNAKMRNDMGLPSHENTVGLAAHDFQNAFLMKEVILSRSIFADGSNKLTSRWPLRIEKLLNGISVEGKEILFKIRDRGNIYIKSLSSLQIDKCQKISLKVGKTIGLRPCPIPPVAVRPKKISLSTFIKLISDPYHIYARDILKLKKIDPLYKPFDARLKGIFLHELMNKFITTTLFEVFEKETLSKYFIDLALIQMKDQVKNPRAIIRLTEELKKKVDDIVVDEIERRGVGTPISLEKTAEGKFALSSGVEVTLIAKADRIDLSKNNELILYDYKSSRPSRRVFEQDMPQLDLEALLAKNGCFKGVLQREVAEVGVINLGSKVSELRREISDSYMKLVESNFFRVLEEIYSNNWGYSSKKSGITNFIGDYDHLARYGEWSILDEPFSNKIKEG